MSKHDLSVMRCIPCSRTDPSVQEAGAHELLEDLPEWERASHDGVWILERTFQFPDYLSGARFVQRVSGEADREGHHPEICLGWKWVKVRWCTHVLKGLHMNDFILAARTDVMYQRTLEGEH